MRALQPRTLVVRALHLFVLWSFAVAQPLFDLLGDTPEFFVVRGSTTLDIVAFGLALVLLPPLLLLILEAFAGLAHARAGEAFHLLFVGVLVALVAVQALKRIDAAPTGIILGGAALAGAAAAVLYQRRDAVRSFVTVLAPAPLVFLALFLLNSPLEKLSLESEALATSAPAVTSTTPVVLVVFDELPVTSLMDERRHVDRGRYPSFASLAADATWFRNATTVHEHTTEAVPAILTGNDPDPGALPLLEDHPDNIFTFLGASHAMHVFEPVTQLCPIDLCPRVHPGFPGRMASLAEDVGLVYLHVVLPEEAAEGLPSVTDTWQNFGKEHADEQLGAKPLAVRNAQDIDRAVGRELWGDVAYQAERYALSADSHEDRPTFYFLHAMLPHSPWRFLPSGRQYAESLGIEGLANDSWGEDEWLVTQGWQRHLLQVGFTDRLLGLFLDRLREEGVYDNALIVVTADHGVSFRPGDRRRGVTLSNIHDIASVPLFVKRPGQEALRVVDRPVRTIDIVPTIADVLGADLSWETDGRSLFDADGVPERVSVEQRVGETVTAAADDVSRRKDETVARMAALFGSGSWDQVYEIGRNAELVGRNVETLGVAARGAVTASIATETLFRAVDLDSSLAPSHVHGRLEGDGAEGGLELAVAVNGRVAAVTRSYVVGDDVRFDAWVSDSVFREGENDVDVYLAVPRVNPRALALLGGTGEGASHELAEDGGAIASGGSKIPVRAGAVDGEVEDWFFEQDTVRIGGWAGVVRKRVAADSVLVFSDGELVYSGSPSVGRADLAARYPGLGRSGFVTQFSRDVVSDEAELRFFAVEDGVASELAYDPSFPWKP